LLKIVLVPINKAGYPFIAIFAVVAVILHAWWAPAGVLGWILTAWCVYFFRDPDRITPSWTWATSR
jgi:phosphatidylserine decarboxylase